VVELGLVHQLVDAAGRRGQPLDQLRERELAQLLDELPGRGTDLFELGGDGRELGRVGIESLEHGGLVRVVVEVDVELSRDQAQALESRAQAAFDLLPDAASLVASFPDDLDATDHELDVDPG
jgi:hypothetical protein